MLLRKDVLVMTFVVQSFDILRENIRVGEVVGGFDFLSVEFMEVILVEILFNLSLAEKHLKLQKRFLLNQS
jgi:hypothetical protein